MFNNQTKTGFTPFANNPQQPQNYNFTGGITQPATSTLFANKPANNAGTFNSPNQNTTQGGFLGNTNQPQQGGFFNQPQQQAQNQGGFMNHGANTPQTGLFNQPNNTNPTPVGGGLFNQANQPSMFGQTQTLNPSFGTQSQGQTFNTLSQPQGFNPQNQAQSLGMMPNSFPQTTTNMSQFGGFNQLNQIPAQNVNYEQPKAPQILSCDYVKQAISHYRKLIQFLKVDSLQITTDNPLRAQKISKVANAFNIKQQILVVKKEVRDHLTNKIKKVKQQNQKLDRVSLNFTKNIFLKLQKYKEKLVVSVSQSKMVDQVKKEVEQIANQINDFFRPLFNAQQNKTHFSFNEPNQFCVNVTEKLYRNMAALDNRMDQILACEGQATDQIIDSGDVIMQLVQYYQNVAIALKDYTNKYNELKRKVLQRNRQGNAVQNFKKLTEIAMTNVKKDMEPYEVVKQIESILEKRQRRGQKKQ